MLMSLGQFIFQTDTLSFHEIQRQRTWTYAENAVASGRAKKQFTGVGTDTITLPGLIYQEYGFGNRFAIDELAAMASTGQGFVLMDGSGYLYGVYVIDNIDETKSILLDNGVPRKVDYTLKLSRTDDERIEEQTAPDVKQVTA
ncbi:phage tail protein [Acinetobacter sp. ANC 3832]|uniref:phage tail protein n=1 Tax=Acinetobacter sp. ANC 3832 TaxID=1977874 RepID=UPI000A34106E|nr:phage tail protein [Acinetobacter sp. ANC 3832]OTG94228.1 oxidoreductase [Acinetobacter sp. ANC 3832]